MRRVLDEGERTAVEMIATAQMADCSEVVTPAQARDIMHGLVATAVACGMPEGAVVAYLRESLAGLSGLPLVSRLFVEEFGEVADGG